MGDLLLGIDIGTSSSKGVLARPDGTVVATAMRPHDLALPQPGWAEHDAEGVWWADFLALCAELVPAARRIAAVCVSGIGPCLLPADAAGRPLRPAILYGIDTRATAEIAEQTARYGAAQILARGGSLLTSQAIGPKLAWLCRHEPAVWAQTRRLFMASSFLVYRLTGEYVLDHHSASQRDPLYDLTANRWIAEWAEEIAPGLPLPRLLWPAEVAGTVTAAAAALPRFYARAKSRIKCLLYSQFFEWIFGLAFFYCQHHILVLLKTVKDFRLQALQVFAALEGRGPGNRTSS